MAILLFPVIVATSLVQAAQTDADAAISSAKEQIVICYQAARDAEQAGANITSLTAILDHAGSLFSQAELAYSINDFETARGLAAQSQETLANFVSDANALKESGIQQRNQDFMINIVASTAGTFAVLGAGAATWLFLIKKHKQSGA